MSDGKHTAGPVNYDDQGGPAFPASVRFHSDGGMTLRDYFAAKAIPALIALESDCDYAGLAHDAYLMADAMLKERSATGQSVETSGHITQGDAYCPVCRSGKTRGNA